MINIIEIKARSNNHESVRQKLKELGADFKGLDHQIDTYFKVNNGRLKLREGRIENNLIHYHRPDQEGPKLSNVTLYKSAHDSSLKKILTDANGILVIVDKKREIYFIDNVKFHIDQVENLGAFVEIEAIDEDGKLSTTELDEQCKRYIDILRIQETDLVSVSYSDLLLNREGYGF